MSPRVKFSKNGDAISPNVNLHRGTDFATVGDERIAEIERRINMRPRKTLGFRSRLDVFAEAFNQGVAVPS